MFVLITAGCAPEWAESPTSVAMLEQQVDAMVDDHLHPFDEPVGLVSVVVADGEELTRHVVGPAHPGASEPMTADLPMPMASATKVLTAIAVMQLVEEGLVDLDDKVTDLLEGLPSAWDGIVVGHLLTHADGLDSAWNHPDWDDMSDRERTDVSFKDYAAYTAALDLLFEPGTKSKYGGQTGFVLLAWLVEEVRGVAYDEALATFIFEPAGMACTGFGNDITPFLGAPSAIWDAKEGMERVDLPYAGPDIATGALMTCLEDQVRLLVALQDGVLVAPATLEAMMRDNRWSEDWGLGWELSDRRGFRFSGHSGGQSVVVALSLDGTAGAATLTNVAHPRLLELGYEIAGKSAQWAER